MMGLLCFLLLHLEEKSYLFLFLFFLKNPGLIEKLISTCFLFFFLPYSFLNERERYTDIDDFFVDNFTDSSYF